MASPHTPGNPFNKPPPHSPESELCLLAGCLADPNVLCQASRTLTPAHFYAIRHQELFRGMLEVFSKYRDINAVHLIDWLSARDLLDGIGGTAYLEELNSFAFYAPTWKHFAETVRHKHQLRELIRVCAEGVHLAYDNPDDSDAAHATVLESVLALRRDDAGGGVTLKAAALGVIQDIETGRAAMVPTGLGSFDLVSGGVPRTGVWVVSGGPASGKTTTVLSSALHMALGSDHEPPRHVRVFSYEQGAQRIAATLLSQRAGCNVHGALNRTDPLSPPEKDDVSLAAGEYMGSDFKVFEGAMNAEQILAECAAHREPGVCVVDYLQLLPPFGKFVEATPRITESMRVLVRIARECGWMVVVVSQIDKAASKGGDQPTMSDGLGSSAIEQYADLFSTVWRPNQKEPMPVGGGEEAMSVWRARQGRMRLAVVKNKYGPVGVAEVFFDGRTMRVRGPHEWELAAWNQ